MRSEAVGICSYLNLIKVDMQKESRPNENSVIRGKAVSLAVHVAFLFVCVTVVVVASWMHGILWEGYHLYFKDGGTPYWRVRLDNGRMQVPIVCEVMKLPHFTSPVSLFIDENDDGLCEYQVHIVPQAGEVTVLSDTDGDGHLDLERVWENAGLSGSDSSVPIQPIYEQAGERMSECQSIEGLNSQKTWHSDDTEESEWTFESREVADIMCVRAPIIHESLWCEARFRVEHQRVVAFHALVLQTKDERFLYLKDSMPVLDPAPQPSGSR